MCEVCFDIPVNQLEDDLFTEDEQNNYIEGVWLGLITKENLSLFYHEKHASLLNDPIVENLVSTDGAGSEIKNDVAQLMRTNVYEFSAAKQYQQAREMSSFITDDITFPEFKKQADEVFNLYNKTHLETEFNTVVGDTQSANVYIDSIEQAADFPLVRYKTQGDGRVREAHSALNNITLPPNHPFWHKYWPLNGWNCRCFVIQLRSGTATDMKTVDFSEVNEGVPPLFRKNPARDGVIFDKNMHPYWDVARGDTQLKEDNFGLPRG